jgi:hypothetical protein
MEPAASRRCRRWSIVAGVLLAASGVTFAWLLWPSRNGASDPWQRLRTLGGAGLPALALLFAAQLVAGVGALVAGVRGRRDAGAAGLAARCIGGLATLAALPAVWFGGLIALFALGGGGWGRPLRVRGRQVHPALREGADWEQGDRPDPRALDLPTRRALQALWLHDAQKEHASVPAFSRVSWLLAALGAPAELLEGAHRAALEEIAHARLCFALAAGYGGVPHTVQPMPELLAAGLDVRGDAIAVIVGESLGDGCQLEDFNADVAAACAAGCEEPATRRVLERIAREERSHAELSWAILAWLVARAGDAARPALRTALARLGRYARPTAVSRRARALVRAADADALRRHGRLPDDVWADLWRERLAQTRQRAMLLLGADASPAAAAPTLVGAGADGR